ncbi:MAG: prepilin-type N-terminal cleavage/methylation domain-containing protein [Duganella sp.]
MTTIRSRPRPHPLAVQRGFTLVEAIVAMVITALIAGTMVLFINRPVRNYVDSAGRAEMTDVADLALRRMARELRASLPNSARVTSTADGAVYLEFIPTSGGGRYLSVDDDAATGTPLSFTDASAQSFTVVGNLPAAAIRSGRQDYIAIYNLGSGFQAADAYTGGNLARVTSFSAPTLFYTRLPAADLGGGNAVASTLNPYAAPAQQSPPQLPNSSPDQRFQVVGKPVIFRCLGNAGATGTLTRSVAPTFSAVPSTPAASAGVLLANNVVACDFPIATNANRQSSLVTLTLALGRAGPDGGIETVTLTHQIHVNNMP